MSEGSETHVHVDVRKMLYCPLRLFTAQCLSALKAAEGRNVSKCVGSHEKSFQWILNSESYMFRTLCFGAGVGQTMAHPKLPKTGSTRS